MATTTEAPNFGEIEEQDDFVGWVLTDETPRSVRCPTGATAFTSGSYLNCCPTSSSTCHIATECVDNTLSYDGRAAITCPSLCATLTILPTNDASSSLTAQSRMFCARDGAADTAYRRLAESDYPQSSITASTETTSTSSTDAGEPTESDPDSGGGSSGGGSKAWIAGAVLGPLLFLALIAIGFLLLRQRRNRRPKSLENTSSPPEMDGASQNFNGATYGHGQAYKPGNPAAQTWNAPAELDPVQRFEMDTSREIPSELAGETGFSPVSGR